MTVHEKLAARLRTTSTRRFCFDCGNEALESTIADIESGLLNDVLGVREPTIEDVNQEAVRVDPTAWVDCGYDFNDRPCVTVYARDEDVDCDAHRIFLRCPTRASAYAALRTMKDYEGEK